MLSSIFGKKSDHPMADIKSAQALLDDLPKNDAHKTLMELTEWIESVSDNNDFKVDHQFAVLRLLDEAAQLYARKLAREYFTPQELNKFHENRLWLALGNFSRHSAKSYCAVFNRYCNGDKGAGAIKAQVPLLVARAVSAMNGQLKYISARYGPIDNAIWGNLARLYKHAEQQQYLDTSFALYSGMSENTSVKSEVGRLLGWYGFGVGALKPLYMHLTERIIARYCPAISMNSQPNEGNLFSFDLSNPAAPRRVHVDATVHPSMRFVSMADMRPKLEELIKSLQKKLVPEDLNLGGTYDAGLVRDAAKHLLGYLIAPPSRRSVRRGIKVNMYVVSSFAKVVELTDVGLNFSSEKPVSLEIEDISTNGFRMVLPAQGTDILIGSLLGVQPDGVQHWGVAVVRRLMRDEANLLHVGVEILANKIAGVSLSQSGGGGGGFEDGQPALWLEAKQGESSGETQLLMMKADTFSANRSLVTRLNEKNYLLIPSMLQEKGSDYDLASFRRIEQEISHKGS